MAQLETQAGAVWRGDLMKGEGTMSSPQGTFRDIDFTAATRFEGESGSNPEEMIGAAHAGCFSMQLSAVASKMGNDVESIQTVATVTMDTGGDSPRISSIHLETEGLVPDMSEEDFKKAAEEAKNTCPVSNALMPGVENITVTANLTTSK